MTPETPIHFSLPEIIQSQEYPRTLLDLEIHPLALADLLAALKTDQTYYVDRICITEGLTTGTFDESGIPVLTETQTLRDRDPEEAMHMLFNQYEAGKQVVRGEYNVLEEVLIFPDTILLNEIVDQVVKTEKGNPFERRLEPGRLMRILTYRLSTECGCVLLHELEHSFQLKLMMHPPPSTPRDLLHHCLEQWAQSKILNPQLADLTYRAVSVKPLISDQQLLGLYAIARERYRLCQKKS